MKLLLFLYFFSSSCTFPQLQYTSLVLDFLCLGGGGSDWGEWVLMPIIPSSWIPQMLQLPEFFYLWLCGRAEDFLHSCSNLCLPKFSSPIELTSNEFLGTECPKQCSLCSDFWDYLHMYNISDLKIVIISWT